jgi:hypothetical protein
MPLHALFGDGVINQGFGDISAFTLRKSPSNDVATEDIDDHVQLEVHPFLWAEQFGYVRTSRCFTGLRPTYQAFPLPQDTDETQSSPANEKAARSAQRTTRFHGENTGRLA